MKSSPDTNEKMIIELSKQHIGNEKELFLTFLIMLTSFFEPNYRVSLKIRGETSEGKTHIVTACCKHLDDNVYAFGSRITKASLEDDMSKYNLIVILEKQGDKEVNQSFKQLSEDGMEIWKKDPKTNVQQHNDKIPRKSIIDTSTTEETDEEVANRALIIHIKSDRERHEQVVKDYSKFLSTIKLPDGNNPDSWIKKHIKSLKSKRIVIPYAPMIPIDVCSARIQRDIKRFWAIVRALAWINQKDRYTIKYKDETIVFSSPEDFMWALYLTEEAFVHSISGISPELTKLLDMIDELMKTRSNEIEGIKYVSRADLQVALGIKTINTIKKRIDDGVNKGVMEVYQQSTFAPFYVRRSSGMVSMKPLIGYQLAIIYSCLKKYEAKIIDSIMIANSYPDNSLITPNNNTSIPIEIDNGISINIKDVPKMTFDELVEHFHDQLITASKNSGQDLDNLELIE